MNGRPSLTLKQRIVLLFGVGTLVPFVIVVLVSHLTIASIQTNQIQGRIQTNLREIQWNLENALENLNHVSQQLALEGSIGSLLEEFMTSEDSFERATLRAKIKSEIALVSYTNPNVGFMMYTFDGGKTHDFESYPQVRKVDWATLPLLESHYQVSYYGPHRSLVPINGRIVLSVLRRVDNPAFQDGSVYLETGFKLADEILNRDNPGLRVQYLFLDGRRRVAYSEAPESFPVGQELATAPGAGSGFVWNEATSTQGWTLVSLVREADFNLERDRWWGVVVVLFLVFAALTTLLGLFLWRMVYRPLGVFQKEMTWIENRGADVRVVPVNIPEFDRLLFQFQEMKERILKLLEDVQAKERLRADLEIEKLLYQINPHFLLNSLNTVHWLAVVHDQPAIDQFTLSLTKLLNYNLGKLGKVGTLREEIEALKDYVAMQSLRYDLRFTTTILVADELLETPLPRFTLQPLVENAIYHGLGEDGAIDLELREDHGLVLTIEDSGTGIRGETDEAKKFGMGIGLSYVQRVLEFHYEGRATMVIEPGSRGTRVTLTLPLPEAGPW